MNYTDQQQQYIMQQQGQRMQNQRMISVPTTMTQHRQQRYAMPMMQPGQQGIPIGSGQYVQNNQMQPRTISDALSRLPPEIQQLAQQQINAETNTERKKQIALSFIQGRVRITQSGYQTQGGMAGSGMMMNIIPNQQVGMQQGGNQMIRMGPVQNVYSNQGGSMQASVQQMAQVNIQRMPTHSYMTGVGVSGAQNIQSYQTQDSNIMPNYNSPQQIALSQPSSVGASMQQNPAMHHKGPNSVPSALYAQHHAGDIATPSQSSTGSEGDKSSDEPMYSQKLDLLKPYHEHIKRLIERSRLDGQAPKSKFERLLEIMENRRKVDLKLLEKLVVSVRTTFERDSLCFPLIDVLRAESTDISKTPLPDPWSEFRQYSIKVPDEVLNLLPERKTRSNASTEPMIQLKRVKKEEQSAEEAIVVTCIDGSQLELSHEASDQLRSYAYRFDPEFAPISKDCTEVQVFIENDYLLIPPLRLIIPKNYPETGASIWRDQWSFGGYSLRDINVQFEKRLNMALNTRSIVEIINAWRNASEHVLKIGTSSGLNARGNRHTHF